MKKIFIVFLTAIALLLSSCQQLMQMYFITATQFSEPTTIKLNLPKDGAESNFVVDNKTYTILIFENSKEYIYQGADVNKQVIIKPTTGKSYLTTVFENGKNSFGNDLKIIIKLSNSDNYKHLINVLDEIAINKIKSYKIEDINKDEKLKLSISQQ